ncbi:hypothetical protein PoB_002099100 [Plakobranchus ocellatus]|uniref:Uncharacterized protein n=1 Tax=Plakobranchus ocellatus TaxID=259542 RepID=A0AAV3ZEZ6_9GAST|nr:hypothetical protein PoB_002099100 [Plakobranchus ocellatus]
MVEEEEEEEVMVEKEVMVRRRRRSKTFVLTRAERSEASLEIIARSLETRRKQKAARKAKANYLIMPFAKNNQDHTPGSPMLGLSMGPSLLKQFAGLSTLGVVTTDYIR